MLSNLWASFWEGNPILAIFALIGMIVVLAMVAIAAMWALEAVKDKYETLWTTRRLYRETFDMETYFLLCMNSAPEEMRKDYTAWLKEVFYQYRLRIK